MLPLTSNGLVASPELVTGGAAIPPRAPALDVLVAAEADDVALAVELENGAETMTASVDAGGSTTTVLVTIEQPGSVAEATSATAADVKIAAAVVAGGVTSTAAAVLSA